MQQIIALALVACAALFLVRRQYLQRRRNRSGTCGGNCRCHSNQENSALPRPGGET